MIVKTLAKHMMGRATRYSDYWSCFLLRLGGKTVIFGLFENVLVRLRVAPDPDIESGRIEGQER